MNRSALSLARKQFRTAFEQGIGQRLGRIGTSLIWKNRDGKPQVLEMFGYQDGHRYNKSPMFFRASVNFRPPPTPLAGFWSEKDEIDTRAPNAHIEITVMLEEAVTLARWLPAWLRQREGSNENVPPPPRGLENIRSWKPQLEHVYLWSDSANKAYLEWKEGQPCPQA